MKKVFLFVFLCLLMAPLITLAHSGNTDSSGGHYCWTDCSANGLYYGQYHFHPGALPGSICIACEHTTEDFAALSPQAKTHIDETINKIEKLKSIGNTEYNDFETTLYIYKGSLQRGYIGNVCSCKNADNALKIFAPDNYEENDFRLYMVKGDYDIHFVYPFTTTASPNSSYDSGGETTPTITTNTDVLNKNLIKVALYPGVYLLTDDNQKRLFPNRDVFKNWYGDDFSGLKTISQEEFDNIPYGKNMTVKSGDYFKFDNSNNIYLVKEGTTVCKTTYFLRLSYLIQSSFMSDYQGYENCQ